MSDKKFSPRDVALAVLKKAEELYKNSTLAKGEIKKDAPMGQTLGAAIGYPGSAQTAPMTSAPAAPVAKADSSANPDAKADAALGEKVEQDVEQHEAQNAAPEHAMPMKGHIKLAKFMGRMEQKRGQKSGEMEKSESDFDKLKNKIKAKEGYSEQAAAATAAKIGREKLGEAEMARRSAEGRKKS